MTTFSLLAHGTSTQGPGGSAYADWDTLVGGLIVVAVLATLMMLVGRPGQHVSPLMRFLLRLPNALARITGLPAWAAITVSVSTVGLVIAGMGFYSDVAYHVAYGRDTVLFTPPHTAIVVGLALIAAGAWAGLAVATVQQVDTALRLGRLRVPWSLLPLGVLGIAALIGFPVDEVWHQTYGVDVTMWSPPHLIMILGAAFSGLAMWLVLAETGLRPTDSIRARVLHVLAALLTFEGFTAPMGEFSFGVPQFQQLYHPVLICLGAGAALTLMRLVLGRGWALGIVAAGFLLDRLEALGEQPVATRPVATFLGAAVAVELVAWLWGTRRRLRFALLSGVGIGTLGLGVEWIYNQQAHQPWTAALLPDAFVVGVPAAIGAAGLGVAIASAITGRPPQIGTDVGEEPGLEPTPTDLSPVSVVLAGVLVVVTLLVPLPRQVGDVTADVTLEETTPGRVVVQAELDPPDAAQGARWFTVGSWQHGGRESAQMIHLGGGVYRADGDVAVDGWSKSLLRLHRGAEMMTVPIRLPADPEIGEPEIPAQDRTAAFEDETRYLLRETTDGPAWLAIIVQGLFALLTSAWVAAFAVAGAHIALLRRREGEKAAPGRRRTSAPAGAGRASE